MSLENKKYKLLINSMVYDIIGMLNMFIPVVGPFLDIVWAPIAAKKMRKMYPNKKGKIASIIVFLEEILPFADVVPTFTLMWLYSFVWNKENNVIETEIIS